MRIHAPATTEGFHEQVSGVERGPIIRLRERGFYYRTIVGRMERSALIVIREFQKCVNQSVTQMAVEYCKARYRQLVQRWSTSIGVSLSDAQWRAYKCSFAQDSNHAKLSVPAATIGSSTWTLTFRLVTSRLFR